MVYYVATMQEEYVANIVVGSRRTVLLVIASRIRWGDDRCYGCCCGCTGRVTLDFDLINSNVFVNGDWLLAVPDVTNQPNQARSAWVVACRLFIY